MEEENNKSNTDSKDKEKEEQNEKEKEEQNEVKDGDKKEENKEDKEENKVEQKEENEKKDEKEEDKKEENKKEEDKKEDEKKEEDNKEDEKKEDDKKEDEKEESPKERAKREKEEKKKKKKEKEREEKERKKKEKEEKKRKEKEEKEKRKKEKEEEKARKNTNIIYAIDEENKKCVDCGAPNPTKVSINNGVIICEKCSKEHESLGHSVSFLKNIEDEYDQFLINFIVLGSNTKFKRFLVQEKIDPNLDIKSKYKTQAAYFYRKSLKAKVEGKSEIEKEFKDANEIIEKEEENIFPEFEKKYVIKNQILKKGLIVNQNKFSFMNIFNIVFARNKKKRGKSLEKNKKKDEVQEENDLNKTSPPIFVKEPKDALESNRPLQESKEEDKKEEKEEKLDEDIGEITTGKKNK